MWALSLILIFLVSIPFDCNISSSSKNPFGSKTIPFPITFIVFGFNIPEGINLNANFLPSTTIVWPALFPPCALITTSAWVAKKSITLPFPSSPHWEPTIATVFIRSPLYKLLLIFELLRVIVYQIFDFNATLFRI